MKVIKASAFFFPIILLLSLINSIQTHDTGIGRISDCSEEKQLLLQKIRNQNIYIVSTLDGKITALDMKRDGQVLWILSTNDNGLLNSTIGNFQLVRENMYFKLIPALNGSLYKLNEQKRVIEPVPLNADVLLKSNYKLGDEFMINGGKELKTFAIDIHSGALKYTCTSEDCDLFQKKPINTSSYVLLIRQHSQRVRAINPQSGEEVWRFDVSENHAYLLTPSDDCNLFGQNDQNSKVTEQNFVIKLDEGVIGKVGASREDSWSYKLDSPIVALWQYNNGKLGSIDLFNQKSTSSSQVSKPNLPYVGSHKGQFYVMGYSRDTRFGLDKPFPEDAPKLGEMQAPANSNELQVITKPSEICVKTPKDLNEIILADKIFNITLDCQDNFCNEESTFRSTENGIFSFKQIILVSIMFTILINTVFFHLKVLKNRYLKANFLTARGSSPSTKFIGKISFDSKNIIGYGSSGTCVYRGLFENKQEIAVKRVIVDYFTLAEREIELLRIFQHQNLLRYYATESDDIFKYIAVELAHFSLADYIEGDVKHTICLDAIEILQQSAQGIEHLHSLNIVHRDIKPQNILISMPLKPNNKRKILISDFGVSKQVSPQTSMSHDFVATTRLLRGTEGWIAPEILKSKLNKKPCEPIKLAKQVDIFSLGCLFYYVLTHGDHPFGSALERQANILKGKVCLTGLNGDENLIRSNLIESMVSFNSLERPNIQAVLKHPAFWTPSRQLSFLQDVSDRLEKASQDSEPVQSLERGGFDVVKGDWRKHITDDLREDLTRFRSYRGTSVRDLLRSLRNKKHHYRELSPELQKSLGAVPDEFVAYFTSRFPRLVIHAYIAMQSFREEHIFKEYYDKLSTFPPLPRTWKRYFESKSSKNSDWKRTETEETLLNGDINYNKPVIEKEENWRSGESRKFTSSIL